VGRALCASLVRDGHAVSVLTRSVPHARRVLPSAVEAVTSLAGESPEAVVNLQGENLAGGRWTAERKQAFATSRVTFTRGLVTWMDHLPSPPSVLVNASAIGWYGDRGSQLLTEDDAPGNDFAAGLCRDWEDEAQKAAVNMRVVCARFGIVLDPSGGALGRMLPAFRFGLGGRMGSGHHWMSWITRHDLVRMIRFLIETPGVSGAVNATAPEPIRNVDFATVLGRVLWRPAWTPLPEAFLRLAFGEMADLLLGSQRVFPQRALAAGFRFEQPGLEAALRAMLSRPRESRIR
jgi:uncharacterized protein (TIGR01777 family)